MYHDLLNQPHQFNTVNIPTVSDLHTGWYQFHYKGGLITGNVVRIGDTVDIKTMTLGYVTMPTLEFINSDFKKL